MFSFQIGAKAELPNAIYLISELYFQLLSDAVVSAEQLMHHNSRLPRKRISIIILYIVKGKKWTLTGWFNYIKRKIKR